MNPTLEKQIYFQRITKPWRDRLLGVALRRANTRVMAEDWVQETLLRAWRDIHTLCYEEAVYAWLLKVLDRVIADDIRKDTRRNHLVPMICSDDSLLEHPCAALGPFEQTLQQQTAEQLFSAIQSLPLEFSEVVLLRDIEELSYQEIAEILEIPQGTVMSRLSRGRRILASMIIKAESFGQSLNDDLNQVGEH